MYSESRHILLPLLLALLNPLVSCINVDTTTTVHFRGDQPGSYFGYTVNLYRYRNIPSMRYVLVGAPRANTSANVVETGDTFRCLPSDPTSCTPLNLPGLSEDNFVDSSNLREVKDGMWMGVSLDSSYATGAVVTCGHRFITTGGIGLREPVGQCYTLRDAEAVGRTYSPCLGQGCQNDIATHGFCMAGMSAHYLRDGSQLYLGAPGVNYFSGSPIKGTRAKNCKNGFFGQQVEYFGYLGYSLTSGRLLNHQNDIVVISATRQNAHLGKIYLSENSSSDSITVASTFHGTTQDTLYGYSMLAVDLNGDGLDELLVSAPLFSLAGMPEIGQVHMYTSNGNSLLYQSAIIQQIRYGRFGTALADLGDLDKDGFPEIAISAPYGDQAGTVFIYSGLATGLLSQTPKQVIRGEDVGLPVGSAFGISISGKQDIDDNGYDDMLVGAYLNDSAVLLRTLPVVTISINPSNTPDFAIIDLGEAKDSGQTQNLTLTSGLIGEFIYYTLYIPVSFTTPGNSPNSMTLRINISADRSEPSNNPRVFFVQNGLDNSVYSEVISLDVSQPTRLEIRVYLRDNRNFLRPVTFDFDYFAVNTDSLDFYTSVVIDNPQGIPRYEVRPNLNCGDDRVCIPDLNLEASASLPFLPNGTRYDRIIAGEVGEFNISVAVSNMEEDSFGTSLQLTLPRGVTYRISYADSQDFVVGCRNVLNQKDISKISCSPLGNPLKGYSQTTVRFQVVLNSLGLRGNEENIRIDLEVLSSNPENNSTKSDNKKSISISVTASADITVSIKAQPEQLVFNETTQLRLNHLIETENRSEIFLSDLGPDVTYLLLVSNRGPSPISNAALNIYWPLGATSGGSISDRAARHFLLYTIRYESDSIRCDPKFFNVANLRESQIVIDETDSRPGENKRRRRRKRQAIDPNAASEETLFDTDVSCTEFRDYCVKIECTLGDLPQDSSYELRIFAKVFEPTFAVNGPEFIWNITVFSEVEILDSFVDQPAGGEANTARTELKLIPSRINIGTEGFTQWWIIVVVVIAFLIVTIPAMIALYFCGFFRKNRSHTARLEFDRSQCLQDLQAAPMVPDF